jgi:hypothetical protein
MKDLFFMLVRSPIVWILVLLVLALSYVGKMDFEDAVLQQDHYCQMVKLHKDTNGDAGWPDYKGIYDQSCPQEANSR